MRLLGLICLLFFISWQAHATHNRSAELTYKHLGGNTYEATVVTFTDPISIAADRDTLELNWGDGTITKILRIQIVALNADVKMNVYRGIHTYAGFGCFKISMQDLNRVAGVLNINDGQSVDIPIYVEDDLCLLDPAIWGPANNSPVTTTLAIDTAYNNQVYYHTMGAYDPDGLDSLHFEFYNPLQDSNFVVPNYTTLTDLVPGSTLTIDPVTGLVTWDKPLGLNGWVNIGIMVTEYRRRYNPDGTLKATIKMGSVKRDLQIFIIDAQNEPPVIVNINDTCIIAGTTLLIPIQVTDADPGQNISVFGVGGPLTITESPATIAQIPPSSTGFWEGEFEWNTVCNHTQPGYYQVIIQAQDNFAGGPATDVETFGIKVVAPAPQNLTADPSGTSIILNWDDPYVCASATRFLGFSVWRREGPNPFDIDTCTPGLAGKGYVKIASDVQAYTYTDNNVDIGKNYCYRVLAEFGSTTSLGWVLNFVESLPSNEACSQLKRDLPVMIEVSVDVTDAVAGTMDVAWTNPSIIDFDTIQNPGPYRYELYRAQGFTTTNPILIQTYNAVSFSALVDTAFLDTGLDTDTNPYTYFIKFFADDSLMGETESASSVFLTVSPAGNQLSLSWEVQVPWTNIQYVVFRSYPSGAPFEVLDTVTSMSYVNTGLKNDTTYCYRVQSIGAYSDSDVVAPLINWSQEECGVPIDTVGACPPTLIVTNVCTNVGFALGDFVNLLEWNKPTIDCGGDAIKYYIYYTPRTDEPFALIDSFHLINDTSFQHVLSNTVAGCYAVAAVDSYYNAGPLSNIVCVDNCPVYQLPNTFTPNADGHNDVFHPVLPYRFVEKVNMRIYTSWGSLVFETNDPAIGWDGVNVSSGKTAEEGTYYYVCEVFEQRLDASEKPSAVLSGFIHLYR